MKLTCELTPVTRHKTLADLEPGVAAQTQYGIRWRGDELTYSISRGYPTCANCRGGSVTPKPEEYQITGRIFGKIDMQFKE